VASIKRLEADLAAAERSPAVQREMVAKVEAMARRKLAALQDALASRDRPGSIWKVTPPGIEPGIAP
jgi:hypothetical protein